MATTLDGEHLQPFAKLQLTTHSHNFCNKSRAPCKLRPCRCLLASPKRSHAQHQSVLQVCKALGSSYAGHKHDQCECFVSTCCCKQATCAELYVLQYTAFISFCMPSNNQCREMLEHKSLHACKGVPHHNLPPSQMQALLCTHSALRRSQHPHAAPAHSTCTQACR